MDNILENLRENAIFLKLEATQKLSGGIPLDTIIKVLKSLTESYNAYIEIEYAKINTQANKVKYNRIKEKLISENKLIMVDLKFESYGMAVTPLVTVFKEPIPNIHQPISWKKEKFSNYKTLFFRDSLNDQKNIDRLNARYSKEERKKILNPLIESIYANKFARVYYRIGEKNPLTSIEKLKDETMDKLLPIHEPAEPFGEITSKTNIALVEVSSGKAKPKVLELFDEVKNPVHKFESIIGPNKTYELKYPLYVEIVKEEEEYIFKNDQIGIYSLGTTLDAAKSSFCEEFEYIYERYNSLPEDKLSNDVIEIRNYVNSLI